MTGETPRTVPDRPPFRLAEALLRWEVVLVLLLGLVFLVNARISPWFLDLYNLADATYNFSEKALIALAMALLILVREIDLSVAAIVALAALVIGHLAAAGQPAPVLAAAGIAAGLLFGMANGALVTLTGVPSIVITIGTMSLFRGIAQVTLGDSALTAFPPGFTALGQSYAVDWPPLPLSLLLFLGCAVAFGVVLHGTAPGRRLYAIGANPVAARFSGLAVNRIRFVLFALSGAMAGLAAVLLTARIGVVRPNIALGWELDVVTMVILGGVSIAGGAGSVPGVVLAVFVLGFTTFGLSLLNVPGPVVNVLVGTLLVASIAAPILLRRLIGRRKR